MTDDRLCRVAQELANEQLQDFEFLGMAERQDELGLSDDELEEVYQLVTSAKAVLS